MKPERQHPFGWPLINRRQLRPRTFKEETLVLRNVFENIIEKGVEKLQANWEGPYVVTRANENGSYHLQTLDGTPYSALRM